MLVAGLAPASALPLHISENLICSGDDGSVDLFFGFAHVRPALSRALSFQRQPLQAIGYGRSRVGLVTGRWDPPSNTGSVPVLILSAYRIHPP